MNDKTSEIKAWIVDYLRHNLKIKCDQYDNSVYVIIMLEDEPIASDNFFTNE